MRANKAFLALAFVLFLLGCEKTTKVTETDSCVCDCTTAIAQATNSQIVIGGQNRTWEYMYNYCVASSEQNEKTCAEMKEALIKNENICQQQLAKCYDELKKWQTRYEACR